MKLPLAKLLEYVSRKSKAQQTSRKSFSQRLMTLWPWWAVPAVAIALFIGALWIGRTPHVIVAKIDVPESMGKRGHSPSVIEEVVQQAVEQTFRTPSTDAGPKPFPPLWRGEVRSILSYGQATLIKASEKDLSVLVPGQGITVMYALYKIASWMPYAEPQMFLQIHYAEAGADNKVDVWLVIDRPGSDRQVVTDRAATSEVADPGSPLNIRLANAIGELTSPRQYAVLAAFHAGDGRPDNGRFERAVATLERHFREFEDQDLAATVLALSITAAFSREPNSGRMHTYEMSLLLDRGLLANPGSRELLAAKSLHLLLHGDPDGATRYAKRLSSEVNKHGADNFGFYGTVAEALQFAVAARGSRWDEQQLIATLQSHFRAWDRWNISRDIVATTFFAACLADTACGKSETLWKLADSLPRGESLASAVAKFGRARAQGDRKVMRKASQEIDVRLAEMVHDACDRPVGSSNLSWSTGGDECLVSLDPIRSAADMLLSESLMDDYESLSEIIETCRRLASLNLWSRRPRLCLADALARSGQYSEALQALDSSLNCGQTEMPLLGRRSDETDAQIYLRIGELKARLGNFSAAEKSLLASVGGNSGTMHSRTEAQRRLALVQAKLCRMEDACKTFSGTTCDELLAPSARYFGDRVDVGWLALESGKPDRAVSLAREKLSYDSQNVDGLKLMGFALLAKQDYGSAEVLFSRALSMASHDSELAQGMAVALSHKRDFSQALKYHHMGRKLSPFDFRQYAALAQTLSDYGYVALAQGVAKAAEPLRPASCPTIDGSGVRIDPRQFRGRNMDELHTKRRRKTLKLPDL